MGLGNRIGEQCLDSAEAFGEEDELQAPQGFLGELGTGDFEGNHRAEAAGLLPAGVGQAAAAAYRELRRVQHRARLDEAPTQVMPPALQAERAAVQALWLAVFGTP